MSVKKESPKIYFENLNAIRFIAASLVIVHHIEQFKDIFHLPNNWDNKVIESLGRLGVVLFFVLSGFLISYLLFKEKELTNTISIRKFYIRRILRIWPLYFLIILSSLFIIPFISFFTLADFGRDVVWSNLFYKLLLFVFFLPNLVLNLFGVIPYASQAWSIGAEEQFYLVWPGLNKHVKNKWALMFGVILFYLVIRVFISFLPVSNFKTVFEGFWLSTPIDCMAIGGLFALIIFENNRFTQGIRKIIFSKSFQILMLLITILFVYKSYHLPYIDKYFHFEFYSIMFGLLICNFAANENRIFSMENRVFGYLGKISYGLYMYHPIIIVLSIKLCSLLDYHENIILYPLVFILVIGLASLSYEFFEKRFIDRKAKYSEIISGDNAKIN